MDTNSLKSSDVQIAARALNRILAFNREHGIQRDRLPESGLLFHYTTAEGLKGIVEKNELWASSAYFLNDFAEVTYGYGVLKDVLDEWISSSGRGEDSLSLGLACDLRRQFDDHLLNKIVAPVYLACFCEDDNLLSQWRAYGASGGYALGFNFFPIDVARLLKPEPNVYTGKLVKVEYERAEQVERCKVILDAVLPIFDDPDVARAIPEVASHGAVNYQVICRTLSDMLMEEAVGYKDKAFIVEKEWRIVIRRRELVKQGTDDGGKTPIPIHFRPARGYLVPYVRLIPAAENAKIPLRVVRSGPTLERLAAVLSVRPFLDSNGFRDVLLTESGISARS